MIYTNNAGLEFEILNTEGRTLVVRFLESGSVRRCALANLKAGKVRDLYSPSRYGVGYDGDIIKTPYWLKAKDLWSNMLKRCYCESDPRGYFGKGVSVDARWHCFANFLDDLPYLDGFDQWLVGGMELDKDKRFGSKVYSRECCQFLSTFENRSIVRKGRLYNKDSRKWE